MARRPTRDAECLRWACSCVGEAGRPLNAGLVDYRILNAADVPKEIHGDIVETPLEDGPWGARGVGEHVMVQTAPAIANAINDALGMRFNDLPLSAEKIFLALQEREQEQEEALS